MRTWLLVGSLAAGVLLFIYEWYNNRDDDHPEGGHGHSGPPRTYPAGDFLEINETIPNQLKNRVSKIPGKDDKCSVCLDPLMMENEARKYCIIALPKCGHWFHQKCAMRLLEYHPQCPECRTPIEVADLKRQPVRIVGKEGYVSSYPSDAPGSSGTNASHHKGQ